MGNKFILGQEDGTVAGGNARGDGAVDLQMSRSAANQVASSNNSTIAGGVNNRAFGIGVFIGGGDSNIAGGADNYQAIAGGRNNSINTGGGAFIGGGEFNSINSGGNGFNVIAGGRNNTVTSAWSTISGGQSNTASTNTHATVVGGQSNVSSGQWGISGGQSSTASGNRTISLGTSAVANATGAVAISAGAGNQTTASGISSVSIGNDTVASGRNSLCTGYFSNAYLYGQKAHSGNFIGAAVQGNCQFSELNPYKLDTLTTGGTTVLSLDGTGTTNLIIPSGNNRMWNVTIKFVAVVTTITGTATGVTVGDTKSQNIEIGFKKVGGVSSLLGGGVFSTAQQDASMASASLVPTAGASQELALTFTAPTFTGGGSVTCRVVAKVELVEVAY